MHNGYLPTSLAYISFQSLICCTLANDSGQVPPSITVTPVRHIDTMKAHNLNHHDFLPIHPLCLFRNPPPRIEHGSGLPVACYLKARHRAQGQVTIHEARTCGPYLEMPRERQVRVGMKGVAR